MADGVGYDPIKDLSLWSLIGANILMMALALAEGWSVMTLLWSYWLQSVIIGLFTVVKILSLRQFSVEGFRIGGSQPLPDASTKRVSAFFFAIHYGFFHFGYMIFLGAFSSVPLFDSSSRGVDVVGVLAGGAIFLSNHLFSFYNNLGRLRSSKPNIGTMMFAPYARIIPMHMTIILGGWLTMFTGSSQLILVLFLVLKTAADGAMHVREHRGYAENGGEGAFVPPAL